MQTLCRTFLRLNHDNTDFATFDNAELSKTPRRHCAELYVSNPLGENDVVILLLCTNTYSAQGRGDPVPLPGHATASHYVRLFPAAPLQGLLPRPFAFARARFSRPLRSEKTCVGYALRLPLSAQLVCADFGVVTHVAYTNVY